MKRYTTQQENFWAGEFGKDYIDRNKENRIVSSNLHLFSTIFSRTKNVNSIIEFGANIGLNLVAIKNLLSEVSDISAIEINAEAVDVLRKLGFLSNVYDGSILNFNVDYKRDFVFTKGVLIHIDPKALNAVYDTLYNISNRYICIAEYYNPTPVELSYRGHQGKLFKRDFAGELMEKYPTLELLDYGFVYHRDNSFPQDDITWFLFEKFGGKSE